VGINKEILKIDGSSWLLDIHDARRLYSVPTDRNMIALVEFSDNHTNKYIVWEKVQRPFGEVWQKRDGRRDLRLDYVSIYSRNNPTINIILP